MSKLLLVSLLWLFVFSGHSQEALPINHQLSKLSLAGKPNPEQLLKTDLLETGLHQLTLLRCQDEVNGNQHCRYQINVFNIPVKGFHLTAHFDARSQQTHYFIPNHIPKNNNWTPEGANLALIDALKIAKEEIPATIYKKLQPSKNSTEAGLIYVPSDYNFENPTWTLAYEIDVYTQDPWRSERLTIDANTGKIIFTENRLCSFASGTAETKYHGTKTIQTTETIAGFVLHDQTRGTGITTTNLNTNDLFYDGDNYWNNANAAMDEVAGDVHWGSGATFDFYNNQLNYHGLDGNGLGINSFVHLNDSRAYWDGDDAYYGDGLATHSFDLPFTYINIIAHEMTHGVTQFNADLIYSGESGALNESFSDIIGVSVENQTNPGSVDWLLGQEISTQGDYFRNMANPKEKGMADTYEGTHWSSENGVHKNSSIGNYWFYLLTEGGSGTNDLNEDYAVEGIGWEKATQIAHHTWSYYLNPSSSYNDCAILSIEAAKSLYGDCSQEMLQVQNAWAAVGLNPYEATHQIFATNQFFCDIPAGVVFSSNSPSQNVLWDFGDGHQSTEVSPTHYYTQNGNYTVSFSIPGCFNESLVTIKDDFITVDDQSTICDTIIMTNGLSDYQTGCTGWLLDDGGENNYGNYIQSNIEIESPFALGYRINFDFFETATGDNLRVYGFDGSSFYLINSYDEIQTGEFLDVPGEKIKLIWSSSWSGSDRGFVVSWQCLRNEIPVADFIVKDSISCNGIHHLFDKSLGVPTNWTWYLNDSIFSTEKNPILSVPLGTYDISLIACNDLGCDTSTMTNIITHNPDRESCRVIPMIDDLYEIAEWCTGTLFDDGGPDENYTSYSNSTVDIAVPGSQGYVVDFVSFQTREYYGKLTILADTGNGFELYESYTGYLDPFTIQIPGERLRFLWEAQYSYNNPGFEIKWTCHTSELPVAYFSNTPTIACGNLIQAYDNSLAFPNQWTWLLNGDSISNEQHPLIELGQPGTYDLGLISCNDFGCDTLNIPDYLVYDNTLGECLNFSLRNNTELYSTACTAQFTDDGGSVYYYSDDINASLEIFAPNQTGYLLNFYSFYTQTEDTLFLYVAENDEFELYETYAGYLGSFFEQTIEANKLKFVWKTSSSGVNSGFLISWDCLEPEIPTALFYENNPSICDGNISLHDDSQGDPTSWIWMLDDTIVSTEAQPEFSIQPGTYDLTLIVCNAMGCDTTTNVDFITYDPDLPNCITTIRMEDDLDLLVDECVGTVFHHIGSGGGDIYSTLEIAVPNANGYKLDFTNFHINSDDTLRIYVDKGNGFELVTALTDYQTNANLNLIGSRIRFIWEANGVWFGYGFEISWTCHTNEIPIANFSDIYNYACSPSFQLKDNSQNFPNRWTWLIDGDSVSNQQFPIIDLEEPGTYDLGLVACNDYGCDTLNIADYLFYEPETYSGCTNLILAKNTELLTDVCSGYFYPRPWEVNLPSEENNASIEIAAPEAAAYSIDFQFFNLLENDRLFLYQDLGNGFELYDIYHQNNPGESSAIEGTRLKFVWKSQNLYPSNAFYIKWICLAPVPLNASFTRENFNNCSENIQLINQSTGFPTSITWLLNNEIISQEADPPLISVTPGSYDVTLIICKETACDTMHQPDYIIFDPELPGCKTVVLTDSLNHFSESCTGTIVNNEEIIFYNQVDAVVTIESPGAIGYEIDLITFSLTYGNFLLEVDNGNGFEFHSYLVGHILPQNFNIIGSRIRFTYDNSYSYFWSDFEIKWQCHTADKPVANFSNTPDISCGSLLQLRDRSTNFPDQWTWLLNDSIVSEEQYPVVHLGEPGTYDLGLIACNTHGCDTLQITDYLTNDSSDSTCLEINLMNNVQLFSEACFGQFFDDGGQNGTYLSNSTASLEIAPPDNIGFFLNIDYLRLYPNDTLKIFVDRGNGFELEFNYNFYLFNVSQIIYGERLKFIFISDELGQGDGFDISWTCITDGPPTVAFDISTIDECLGQYQLIDESSVLTNSWTWLLNDEIIDTVQHPVITTPLPGSYDVTLIACNEVACDTNTVEDMITFDPSLPVCSYYVMRDSLNLTTESCQGIFVDDGGIYSNYSHYGFANLKVASPNAHAYKIKFNFFETENIFDFLTIYTDNGIGFEPVASYAGTHTGLEFFVTGTRILFQWESDNSVNRPGFEVEWACVSEPVIAPTIERSDCENSFDFTLNSPNTDAITWYFGDGDWGVGPNFNHRYETPGSYEVIANASNEFGDTTFTRMVEAVYPFTYFEAPDNIPLNELQTVQILAPAPDQIQNIQWKLDGIDLDNSYALDLLFDQNGSYELKLEITDLDGCISTHTATIIAGVVNTQEFTNTNIRIYPNPTKDLIHLLNLQSLNLEYSLTLVNTIGQRVYEHTPTPGTEQLTIDLRPFPAGVYYLNIASPDQQYRGKRIVKID